MPLIFITGGGRRIGRGLAIEFSKKGWDVAITFNNSSTGADEVKSLIEAKGSSCFAVKADMRDLSELELAFDECKREIGTPNVLINNAGIYPPKIPLNELTEEIWDNTLNVNLRGQMFASKVFSGMAKTDSRIINIGSLGGRQAWKQRIPYNVSKAGVLQLTRVLAKELAPGISVNCVCPGTIVMEEDGPEPVLHSPDKIPMQRFGTINDIFDAVYFFASSSIYITGQIINVDGGTHLYS